MPCVQYAQDRPTRMGDADGTARRRTDSVSAWLKGPIYEQIMQQLSGAIARGDLKLGEKSRRFGTWRKD